MTFKLPKKKPAKKSVLIKIDQSLYLSLKKFCKSRDPKISMRYFLEECIKEICLKP